MTEIHTENRIFIKAPPDIVYELAVDITRWPDLLRHYRQVRVLSTVSKDTRRVKMAASRSGIPVSWTAVQERRSAEQVILYRHVGGATRGMEVTWRIVPASSGVEVTIEHHLDSPRRLIRSRPAAYITGRVFVEHIASKTLQGIKHHAERLAGRRAAS